jgi:hypothetical protein
MSCRVSVGSGGAELRVDYELPSFNYATTEDISAPLLGYADDNYRTGTQSFVFNFVSPGIVELGYGLTTTMIHEVGHHLAMSHPHDGYDSETGVDYDPTGPFYFAASGDQSNTMMSYIDLNWDFSQFDRDNMNRYMTAAFAENANRIAADVLADPDAGRAADELAGADQLLGASKVAFRGGGSPVRLYNDRAPRAGSAGSTMQPRRSEPCSKTLSSARCWAPPWPPAGSGPRCTPRTACPTTSGSRTAGSRS